jgi:hypothetical protein
MSHIPFCKPQFLLELRMSAITRNKQTPSIELKTELIGKLTKRKINATALLDSGAEGIIINNTFTTLHNLNRIKIPKPFPVRNVDGSENVMGWVTHYTIQTLRIYAPNDSSFHEETSEFYITDIGDHDIILGTDWLEHHNPSINWSHSEIEMTCCPSTCKLENPPVKISAKSNQLNSKQKKTEETDPRVHHRDYQVLFKEPTGL